MEQTTSSATIIIKPTKGWASLRIAELWRYRELFYFLAWRDIKVRYKQTVLGVLWAIINPLVQMIVWTFIFSKVANLPSSGIPYALITLSGTLAWNYFSEIVNGSANSLISNTNLITKIYFPRLIIPLSIALRALLDFSIAFLVSIGIIFYYKVPLTFAVLALPIFIFLVTLTATGVGLFMAAMSVKYRDVAKILPYFIQLSFFLTPVAYLNTAIPVKYQWLYYFNPMAGIIDGFRWSLLGLPINWLRMTLSSSLGAILFIFPIFYFRKVEKTFADVI